MSNEKRAPLSDPVFNALKDMRSSQWAEGFREATSIYEYKIASGELRVVETASDISRSMTFKCSSCASYIMEGSEPIYCPGCGAYIV